MLPTDPAILILEVLGFTSKDFDLFVALGQGCTCVRQESNQRCHRCRLLYMQEYKDAYRLLARKGLMQECHKSGVFGPYLTEEGQAIFDGIYKPKGKKHEEEGSG